MNVEQTTWRALEWGIYIATQNSTDLYARGATMWRTREPKWGDMAITIESIIKELCDER